MKVFRAPGHVPADFGPSVVTIGNFDGVHVGHRHIIRQAVEAARSRGFTPVALTFDPHPARILAPDRAPRLIMTVDQRLRSLASEGIEAVLLLPFSLEFAKLSPEAFAREILAGVLHAKFVLVGEDFRFGYKQSGDVDTLRSLGAGFGSATGFEVEAMSGVFRRGERVSSSAIRKLISSGAVSRACRTLGAPFALEGKVVSGRGIGSKQTVPTLNLSPRNELLPAVGVYVTRTRDLNSSCEWASISNIGYRPTFESPDAAPALTVETFLLDPFDGTTPEHIEVAFLSFIRNERKFVTADALRHQILRDAGAAKRTHRRLKKLVVG